MDKGVIWKIRELGQILKDQPDQDLNSIRSRKLRQEISHLLNMPTLIADHPETFLNALVIYCDRAGSAEAATEIRAWLRTPANMTEPFQDAPRLSVLR